MWNQAEYDQVGGRIERMPKSHLISMVRLTIIMDNLIHSRYQIELMYLVIEKMQMSLDKRLSRDER